MRRRGRLSMHAESFTLFYLYDTPNSFGPQADGWKRRLKYHVICMTPGQCLSPGKTFLLVCRNASPTAAAFNQSRRRLDRLSLRTKSNYTLSLYVLCAGCSLLPMPCAIPTNLLSYPSLRSSTSLPIDLEHPQTVRSGTDILSTTSGPAQGSICLAHTWP